MRADEARRERLEKKTAATARPAWIPRLAPGDEAGVTSKLSGTPWLPEGEEAPSCKSCKKPMHLLLQLDRASLPAAAGAAGEGLIQVFHCGRQRCDEGYTQHSPGGRGVLLRVLKTDGGAAPKKATAKKATAAKTAKAATPAKKKKKTSDELSHVITGWDERVDFPSAQEAGDLGLTLNAKEQRFFGELERGRGHKLGGWADWIQSPDYPRCPTCEEKMELIFQLRSGHHIPVEFGDSGLGYVTQCPKHPKKLAFSWSST